MLPGTHPASQQIHESLTVLDEPRPDCPNRQP